ncbi:hypothetical protein [Microbacterium pumilum]|uniref:Lipoprotein LpqB N-terminal domain-containing protein n=1 Tax=Microbacterium pumilum TaxID=344165 RepID=A0ABN2T1B1_9MICO
MSDDARRPRWALVFLLAAVGVVVVIALVAVFTRGAPTQYAADTPEGVVQRYSQAVVDDDTAAALEYVVPEIADSCEESGIGTDDYRVTLLKTTERDDTARVGVLVTTVYGSGPLGSSEYESEESFDLVKSGDSWLIDRAPWQLAVCYELGE